MKNLSYQEMLKNQQRLLTVQLPLKLNLKNKNQNKQNQNKQDNFFVQPNEQLICILQKYFKYTINLTISNKKQKNQLDILTYCLLCLIFKQKASNTQQMLINGEILQQIKCSIFSLQFNLSLQENEYVASNLQIKSLIARFLNYIQRQVLKDNKGIKELIKTTLIYNSILCKIFQKYFLWLLIQQSHIKSQRQVCNSNTFLIIPYLLQYFDINYKVSRDIIIIPEYNLFIASINKQLITGQYFQNQNLYHQYQLYSASNSNTQQHFSTGREQNSMTREMKLQDYKFDNDDQQSLGSSAYNREIGAQTPCFGQNLENNFNFGKKKLDQSKVSRQKSNGNAPISPINQNIFQNQKKQTKITQCQCKKLKLQKNELYSNVVNFLFVPPKINHHFKLQHVSSLTSPKFNRPIFVPPPFKKPQIPNFKSQNNIKQIKRQQKKRLPQERTPTFIKTLKKDKSSNQFKPHIQNIQTKGYIQGRKQQIKQQYPQQIPKYKKPLQFQGLSNSLINQESHENIMKKQSTIEKQINNARQIITNKSDILSGRGKQSYTSLQTMFYQNQAQFNQLVQKNRFGSVHPNYDEKHQITAHDTNNSKMKFYAPIQIIAPTVVVSGQKDGTSNIIFKVHGSQEIPHEKNWQKIPPNYISSNNNNYMNIANSNLHDIYRKY